MATHTDSGIRGVGEIAWGDHVCLFQGARDELAEPLVPFIKAGLESREQCIWLASDELGAEDVRAVLRAAVPGISDLEQRGQLVITSQGPWCPEHCAVHRGSGGVAASWQAREARALEKGFAGLRAVCHMGARSSGSRWQALLDYESEVSAAIEGRRVVTLCGYRLGGVSGEDILDVIPHHLYGLAKRGGSWKMVESESMNIARQELRRISEIAEFREQFLGVVSHDLRNPLNSIMLAACTLMCSEGEFDAAVRRKLYSRIVNSTQRMGQLITDLLDFTRVRIGQGLPIQIAPADINAVCRTVCEELELAHPGRRIELHLDAVGPGMWDRARLVQAISNVVGNALQYSPVDSSVTVRTYNAYGCGEGGERDGLHVEVHNWGEPIPKDLMPRLFEPFHGSAHARPSSGLGLGLFIAERIIAAHGGRVSVHSSVDDGIRFTIYLPLHPGQVAQCSGQEARVAPA